MRMVFVLREPRQDCHQGIGFVSLLTEDQFTELYFTEESVHTINGRHHSYCWMINLPRENDEYSYDVAISLRYLKKAIRILRQRVAETIETEA